MTGQHLALALATLLGAAPARADEEPARAAEEEPLDEMGSGGLTVRLLAAGGSAWSDTPGVDATPFAAGGALALDFWNREHVRAVRLGAEAGSYGVALECALLFALGDRWSAARLYAIIGLTLGGFADQGGVGGVLGAGLQLDVAGPFALSVEARLHGVGGEEDEDGNRTGATGSMSVLAGIALTF